MPWVIACIGFPARRRVIIWAGLFTTPFGLTAPLFVSDDWNPPSLFDLAGRSGFDIESLIFCFGIGGIGAVLYGLLAQQTFKPTLVAERRQPHHLFISGRSPHRS